MHRAAYNADAINRAVNHSNSHMMTLWHAREDDIKLEEVEYMWYAGSDPEHRCSIEWYSYDPDINPNDPNDVLTVALLRRDFDAMNILDLGAPRRWPALPSGLAKYLVLSHQKAALDTRVSEILPLLQFVDVPTHGYMFASGGEKTKQHTRLTRDAFLEHIGRREVLVRTFSNMDAIEVMRLISRDLGCSGWCIGLERVGVLLPYDATDKHFCGEGVCARLSWDWPEYLLSVDEPALQPHVRAWRTKLRLNLGMWP